MLDERGKPIKSAGPSTPVSVLGLSGVPAAGQAFEVVADERAARALVAERTEAHRLPAEAARPVSLDDIYARFKTGQAKELNLIIKADVQGSLEPIVNSLNKLEREGLKVSILHQETGNISESDVMLASASHAIVIGFSVLVDEPARRLAEADGVDVRVYDIIYKLIDDVDKALTGLLEPQYKDVVAGKAEVRQVFRVPKVGHIAGCYVTEGVAQRSAQARVVRNGKVLHTGPVASLKRFTEDAREVRAGYECGVGLEGFDGVQVGDVIEFVVKQKVE
jgi:translation initiation factor IF-2